ncbi:DoxX family membrane protein [uncultured Aquimarina sp.]|uniref:DoxX family membrane protein n=1 Tax=uncultured Aquimarina sp. TaxID=575652 RepID=UPI00261C3C4D|nr:DoxX family membrane protein [uncultured Aquimarina sp.]
MKQKILFVVSLLFGLMMINSGLNSFFSYMPMPEVSEAGGQLMYAFANSKWLFPLIGIAEIIGGALFISNKLQALGAIIILPVTVGILLFHLVNDPAGILISVVLFAINLWVIIENREKYNLLIK